MAYSTRTQERIALTTWDKIDFPATAFGYGLAVSGFWVNAFDIEGERSGSPTVLAAATGYTALSLAYLGFAEPDRGDLPLILGITGYAPLVPMLASLAATDNVGRAPALLFVGTSLVAMPAALYLANTTNVDPGDATLVRDATFWGFTLSLLGAIEGDMTGRGLPMFLLAGLGAGAGLGALVASKTDLSVERVRAISWGGYGGALMGSLLAASGNGGNGFGMIAAGALVGLGVTAAFTRSFDEIPEGARLVDDEDGVAMTPGPTTFKVADGSVGLGLGFSGTF